MTRRAKDPVMARFLFKDGTHRQVYFGQGDGIANAEIVKMDDAMFKPVLLPVGKYPPNIDMVLEECTVYDAGRP